MLIKQILILLILRLQALCFVELFLPIYADGHGLVHGFNDLVLLLQEGLDGLAIVLNDDMLGLNARDILSSSKCSMSSFDISRLSLMIVS